MSKKKELHLKNKISKTPKRTFKLDAKILQTWIEKANGLTGISKIYPVYFETKFGIHTFGMKKPIDVFILNKDNKVVKIKRNINPWNVFFWNPKYFKIIETPISFLKAKISDKIIL